MSIAMSAASYTKPPRRDARAGGRLRDDAVGDGDRNICVFVHLSLLLGAAVLGPLTFLIPLVLWLTRKDESGFVDDHGREVLNFCISFALLTFLLPITIIGIAFVPVLWIVGLVNVIRGAMAAHGGEYFRYPLTIRFLR